MSNFLAQSLCIRNIGMQFGEKVIWIKELDIPCGALVAIIGASGSGKSTFLHMIAGFSKPNFEIKSSKFAPSIKAFSEMGEDNFQFDILKHPHKFRNNIGFIFQSAYLLQYSTASANISLGAITAGLDIRPSEMRNIADDLEISRSFLVERCSSRSGGERQRIAIGRAIARTPKLVLADEPTANLDPRLAEDTIALLRNWTHSRKDRTTIWVTHDVNLAARFADFIVVLHNGYLPDWGKWPATNPSDPAVLRCWIDGYESNNVSSVRLRPVSPAPLIGHCGEHNRQRQSANAWQKFRFWLKLGVANELSGAEADRLYMLRRWTSVAVDKDVGISNDAPVFSTIIRCLNSKLTAFRLALVIAAMIVVAMQIDYLNDSIRASLISPTINPIVISSRALIDDDAVNLLRKNISTEYRSRTVVPEGYGRFEFDHRRLALLRQDDGHQNEFDQCKNGRDGKEMIANVAALHPDEPLFRRISTEGLSSADNTSGDAAGVWPAAISITLFKKLQTILGAPANLKSLCVHAGGSWLHVQIVNILPEPPRGRFGPYDLILSLTQWRDFGPARDREYYQSAAIYFDIEPDISSKIVDRVREINIDLFEPPNTRLEQSLLSEAAFERISAALERSSLSIVIAAIIAFTMTTVFSLLIVGFISENFRNNLKSICVALAMGASAWNIFTMQFTRVGIVLISTCTIVFCGIAISVLIQSVYYKKYTMGAIVHLLGSAGIVLLFFISVAVVITLVANWWYFLKITRRPLSDQLKELE
jgi:ABC-type lipoprotein export system ATPase subunit